MEKPKGRVYWTQKHIKHDEAGVLVIGRTVIPMVLLYVGAAVTTGLLLLYGFIFSEKGPDGKIADGAAFMPTVYFLMGIVAILVILGIGWFFRWVRRILKEAQDGLDKSRWNY